MDPTRFIMPTLQQSHLYNKPSKKRVEPLYFPLQLILMNRKQKFKDHLLVIGQYNTSYPPQQSRIKPIQVLGTPGEKKLTGNHIFYEKIVKIYSQASVIAILTKKEQAWLLIEPFDRPVNISKLIHKKIMKIFLGQKQMVVLTKNNQYILLNWGTVKKIQKNIVKISTFNQNNQQFLFQAFLLQAVEEGTLYYYNLDKKILNSNIFYEIKGQSKEIIGYPIMNTIKTLKLVKGISVGKHHSLYWDEDGSLYSWGSRSLALGYGELPSDNVIEEPQKIEISKKVLMAFAATHYSLALTSEGLIYQWGIKMQVNHLNEDPIFNPRPIQFKYFKCKAKFISLKGKDNNFAALSSNNHLYVWGHDAKPLINPALQLPEDWKGNYLYEPVLQTDLLGCKILDFSIQSEFLSVVTGNQDIKQEQIQQYWQVLRQKAKLQLIQFKTNRIQTQNSEYSQFIDEIRNKYKKNSILFAKCLQKKIVTPRILQQNSIKCQKSQRKKSEQADKTKLNPFKKTAPVLSSNFWPQLSNHKRQVSDCFGSISPVFKENFRCSQIVSSGNSNSTRREKMVNDKKANGSYSNRLQVVLEKKKMMEQQMMAANLKKIDESSIQFKLKKKQEQIEKQKKLQYEEMVKATFGKFFFKIYLANMLKLSADEGRRVKIVNFKRTLVLNRVQKNIKRLFFQSKIKFALQALQKQNVTRFSLLNLHFKRYVQRFRARRRRNAQKMMIQQIVKFMIKQKFHVGIFQIRKRVMKVQKVGQWIHIFNKQRMRILKQLWNNFLLLTLKVSDGNQFILQSSLNSQATFAQKFSQARKERKVFPLLSYYKCSIRRRSKKFTQNQMLAENRRKNMRLFEGLKDKLFNIQILPYSMHYNYFKKPKHLDIIINQGIKISSSWTDTERKAQAQLLRRILRKNDLEFIAKKRKYQIDLANYLRNKYDTFYELRWKFIIQYNKTEKTLEKRAKQKQLRRILKLIGMERLVDQDCIPQKHLVLEEALKRRDVPVPPSPIIIFDIHKFEHCYKAYWEFLHEKASIRKGSNIKRSPKKKMRNKRQDFSEQQDQDAIYQCAELKNVEFAL